MTVPRPTANRAASYRGPRYYRVRRRVRSARPPPYRLKRLSVMRRACALPWPTPLPGLMSGSAGSAAADDFAEADCEPCCELPWPALLPGATPGSIGSAAPMTPGEAECEGCSELPCTAATPGAVSSAACAFAAAGFEACCALPRPTPLPGSMSGSAGSADADDSAEADCEPCCELPWPPLLPVMTPGSTGWATATGATIAAPCMPNSKSSSPVVACAVPCPVVTAPVFTWPGSCPNVRFSSIETDEWL